jgi:hypothetical protein
MCAFLETLRCYFMVVQINTSVEKTTIPWVGKFPNIYSLWKRSPKLFTLVWFGLRQGLTI